MSITNHYLSVASQLIQGYKGVTPFAISLKQYFAQHKKYGSRDRKAISQLCYTYFRVGNAIPRHTIEEKILISVFFCSHQSNPVLKDALPELDAAIGLPLDEKEKFVGITLKSSQIFPWQHELNEGFNTQDFAFTHLQQPNLFLRIRPGFYRAATEKLTNAGILFTVLEGDVVSMQNASNLEGILHIDKEAVVQDYSSQRTGKIIRAFLEAQISNIKLNKAFWDCCTASGGKSIMLHDLFPALHPTVSDIRPNILTNLRTRFKEAGIAKYHAFVADLSQPNSTTQARKFPLVLADVPCTGSGTWARTPEQLHFFKPESISWFASQQLAIASNAVKHLQEEGYFVYITCSAFKQENDDVVEKLLKNNTLKLVHSQIIDGTKQKADSMYIAIMKKV